MIYILIACTLGIFTLPLIPALREWCFPTDNAPLRVVQEYDGDIRHFASSFRNYVTSNFGELLGGQSREGVLGGNTPFQIVGEDSRPVLSTGEMKSENTRKLILSRHELSLPDNVYFESEIYSANAITGGIGNNFRAMLAEGDITLKKDTTVLRWVHSGGTLTAEENCRLYGRASSEKSMSLGAGCSFVRLHSARIAFGMESLGDQLYIPLKNLTLLKELPGVIDQSGRRSLVNKNVDIAPRHLFEGDIVAGGDVRIGSGSQINGSVKSNGNCVLGTNVVIVGSVVSAGELHIGPGCRILGPVLAERIIRIESGCTIGSETQPTSISAPFVEIETKTVVYGTVWAAEEGTVIAAPAAAAASAEAA